MAGDKRVKWYDRQQVDLTDQTTEQEYHITRTKNIFDRLLGDGVTSGLLVTDDSQMVFQDSSNATETSQIDTLGNQVIQIFLATADNLQSVIARMRNVDATGNVTASIYTLATPTDPTSALSSTAIAQAVVSSGSIGAMFGEVTFDFSAQAAVADAGRLTVGNYYAVAFARDSVVGSIDIRYSTSNQYDNGYVRYYDFPSDTYTNYLTRDLYIKVFTDAVQIATGIAYKNGDPIEVNTVQRKVNLADTSGVTNYITLKYKETLTDQETNPRLGTPEYSRIQDDFEVVVRTSLASIASDEESVSSTAHTGAFPLIIADLRVFIPGRSSLWDAYINKNVLLTGETVQSGLSIKDCVYYNNTNSRWEKASYTNLPRGILTSSGEVTLFGQKTGLSGLTANSVYYMDSSGNLTTTQTHIRIGGAYSTTVLLVDIDIRHDINNILTVANDNYTILDNDYYSIVEVTTGDTDRIITLPSLANNLKREISIIKIDRGTGVVTATGTINGQTNVILPRINSKIALYGNSSEWKTNDIRHDKYDTGWIRRSDWTNVHLGSVKVIYNNLVGTFQSGEIITEAISGITGIVTEDDGANLYLESVTGLGIFTNGRQITGGTSGATADVNGNTINQDVDILHNFRTNMSDLNVYTYISSDATDNNSIEIDSSSYYSWSTYYGGGGEYNYGIQIYQVNNNSLKIQTAEGGIHYLSDAGTESFLDSGFYYYRIVIKKTLI